ncbi:MAG: gliding motility-associated C-terminal domain-containing protein [Flavobacteriales bacterium]|nr:gliding motility-associated C-terminal domain-containing protein [Flavobacteriales bacterium]MCB9191121.1 gliding motility-associated C-terminal domain-containing protein [Flavobacteriales bacterium]MCB9203467.1 gliding motility-associated C-terminal domain-containing protein [Flavobacteriales bacterium]
MKNLTSAYLFISLFLMGFSVLAQPTYNLVGNLEVDDCEGYFFDSDAGLNGQDYGHGEDYTFQICVPNAISIEMTFFDFCSEAGFDVMTFYDGPDVNAPMIGGPYSGQDLPPTIIATSGCLTVHWESDAFGVACDGWSAYWEVEVEEPEPPVVTFDPSSPTCSTEVIIMEFDTPVPCDSVYAGAFTLNGGQTITNINPLNCAGGEGTQYELTLAPSLDESMTYNLEFVYHYADDCDNEFTLEVDGSFDVNDCPLQVEVFEDATTICEGECIEIWAEATGGNPNTYNYAWSNGLPNSPGPHLVCPTTTTTYTVTVSDASPAASASDQTTIMVIPPPTIDPIPDVCRNNGAIPLTANPPGGTWSGSHVPDPNPIFRPDSGWGNPWTYYTDLNGCTDSIQSQVYDVWAGFDQSSCPGEPPFQLDNGVPAGGVWSGPFTTPDGMFDPSTPGTYNITYTTTDGCTDIKVVRVENIAMPADITVCQSDPEFNLSATPFGGVWSGPGVANWYWGTYRPADAGPGTHVINYEIVGCSATMNVAVTEIDAGGNYVICPEEPAIQLNGTPAGGTWSGIGVSPSGLYDPTIAPDLTNDTLTYSINGCTDTRVVFVQQTAILWSNLEFCLYDDALELNWAGIHRYPGGGTWSGPGTDNNGAGHFTPALAGGGTHTLYYEANTCIDSTVMIVHENNMFDTSICESGNPIQLMALPAGGTWDGPGIIDPSGTFDPQDAGLGQHYVYYQGPSGCWDSCMVDVYQLQPAEIIGLQNTYCFIDSAISLIGLPAGGAFTGNGMTDTIFNPSMAGPGIHEITYTQGAAGCEVSDDMLVSVSDQIITTSMGDGAAVCLGNAITVGVEATGGNGTFFTYTWNPNVSWFATQELYPDSTTSYVISTSDGCSDPAIDTIDVFVYPPFSAFVETSAPQCYGNTGYITVRGEPASPNYVYEWNTSPPSFDATIFADVGLSYEVTITDLHNGNCTFDTLITIPAFPNVTAHFTPNPNGNCLLESDPIAEFIDLSQGAATGTWDFGDGTQEDYVFGQYPVHEYADTGTYTVTLYVENADATCTDEYEFDVCVQPEFKLWIPNAFTPDGDGLNDYFEIVSSGIVEFELLISSSWGHKIYRMTSIDDPPWDGTYKGNPVQQDRYIYEVIAKGRHLGGVKFYKGSGYIHVIRH